MNEEKPLGVMLAEAEERLEVLRREMSIVQARIRTLTAEVLADARRDSRISRRTLRVPPYADGMSVESHAEEAHALIHSPTVKWPRHGYPPPPTS